MALETAEMEGADQAQSSVETDYAGSATEGAIQSLLKTAPDGSPKANAKVQDPAAKTGTAEGDVGEAEPEQAASEDAASETLVDLGGGEQAKLSDVKRWREADKKLTTELQSIAEYRRVGAPVMAVANALKSDPVLAAAVIGIMKRHEAGDANFVGQIADLVGGATASVTQPTGAGEASPDPSEARISKVERFMEEAVNERRVMEAEREVEKEFDDLFKTQSSLHGLDKTQSDGVRAKIAGYIHQREGAPTVKEAFAALSMDKLIAFAHQAGTEEASAAKAQRQAQKVKTMKSASSVKGTGPSSHEDREAALDKFASNFASSRGY